MKVPIPRREALGAALGFKRIFGDGKGQSPADTSLPRGWATSKDSGTQAALPLELVFPPVVGGVNSMGSRPRKTGWDLHSAPGGVTAARTGGPTRGVSSEPGTRALRTARGLPSTPRPERAPWRDGSGRLLRPRPQMPSEGTQQVEGSAGSGVGSRWSRALGACAPTSGSCTKGPQWEKAKPPAE